MNGNDNKKSGWETIKYLSGIICMGFLYGIFSLVFLAMLLQWTLEIDITEFDKIYRLLFLVWAGWVIGLHVWLRKEKRIPQSPKEGTQTKKENQETDPRSYDPFYISDKFNPNLSKLNKKNTEEESDVVFFRKNPSKSNENNEQTKL
ncbi:hypothetical protein A2943_00785 [Candidatus Adlerbacteria bacterium RIFCSPLOWO2_01_FULL_51_16]|uniref:Uncharacterized protein n=1 Tax=Candidatus Adlerbacteria bacterium RIFCSPLOWO2_01_FULL_51_16 TaxID=1797243 RepID=A0A1F4XHL6_9BACT|nr:MAG: hypothetical protein A2943_00785 [Candidatus Adlerbacteria bacterium RIFCSPLOWO2_01_FULL_51_16]